LPNGKYDKWIDSITKKFLSIVERVKGELNEAIVEAVRSSPLDDQRLTDIIVTNRLFAAVECLAFEALESAYNRKIGRERKV